MFQTEILIKISLAFYYFISRKRKFVTFFHLDFVIGVTVTLTSCRIVALTMTEKEYVPKP